MARASEMTFGPQAATASGAPSEVRIDVVLGTEPVMARVRALEAAQGLHHATAFQSSPWLSAVARALGRIGGGDVLALEAVAPPDAQPVMLLPLAIRREGGLRVARVLDIGVSDYRAPLLEPAVTTLDSRALWRAVLMALRGRADLVRLEAMPAAVDGVPNPLAASTAATRARLTGFRVTVGTTVEQLLRDRGKKYRKEAERCFRLIEKEGEKRFRRATTADSIERAYAALEAQQSQRHGDAGNNAYVLDQPLYSDFYRDLLLAERDSGFARIFTLEAGSQIVAVLMGIVRGGTFTLLRISNGGAAWRHLSPGRLIVIEAMRHLVAEGVRDFDMGAGDYPFKRGFGADEIPLFDLVAAVSARGLPAVALERGKAWLRSNPALVQALRRVSGRSSSPRHDAIPASGREPSNPAG